MNDLVRKKIWKKLLDERLINNKNKISHLHVKEKCKEEVAVFGSVLPRIKTNIDTHQVIYLPQQKNGHITWGDLCDLLDSTKKITSNSINTSPNTILKTVDGKPGIADIALLCNDVEHEIAFVKCGIYREDSQEFKRNGGIFEGDITVDEDALWERSSIVTGTVHIKEGVILSIANGCTLTAANIEVHGTLNGGCNGNIHMCDNSKMNGAIYAGNIKASGNSAITGMYCIEEFLIEEKAKICLAGAGILVNCMRLDNGCTLEMLGAEPITCQVDFDKWYVDVDHSSEQIKNGGWYISYDSTLTDVLGRSWMCELSGQGMARPDIKLDKEHMGTAHVGKNVTIEGVGDSKNYCVMFGDDEFAHVSGYVFLTTIGGQYISPQDKDGLIISEVSGEGTKENPYKMSFERKNRNKPFEMPEELVIQALTGKKLEESFEGKAWRFMAKEDGYVWYAYDDFADCEHWHGANGKETITVYLHEM